MIKYLIYNLIKAPAIPIFISLASFNSRWDKASIFSNIDLKSMGNGDANLNIVFFMPKKHYICQK